jgi:hypothetical protein
VKVSSIQTDFFSCLLHIPEGWTTTPGDLSGRPQKQRPKTLLEVEARQHHWTSSQMTGDSSAVCDFIFVVHRNSVCRYRFAFTVCRLPIPFTVLPSPLDADRQP